MYVDDEGSESAIITTPMFAYPKKDIGQTLKLLVLAADELVPSGRILKTTT